MKTVGLLLSTGPNIERERSCELEHIETAANNRLPRVAAVALLALVWMFLWSPAAKAATKTSTGTGNWNTNGTWSPSGVPGNGDDVIIAATHNVTVNTNTNSLASLTVNGTLTVGSNGTSRTVTVTGNVSVASAGTIICGSNNATHTMNIGGNLSNAGTFDGQATASRVINVTFNGSANQTVSGAGATTRFNTITINNSTATSVIEVTSSNFAAAAGFLTLTKGIFKVSGSFTFSNTFFATAAYSIPTNTGLWINNSNVTVTGQNGDPTVTGLLRISQGTYNVGTVADNDLDYATGSTVDIQGGALNITGAFQGSTMSNTGSTSTTTYSQSGGTVTVAMLNVLSDITQGGKTYGSFDIAASGSSFTMSAGTIVLQNPTSTQNDCVVGAATNNVTGGTFQFGNASMTVTNPYAITCSTPMFNITIKAAVSPFAELLNSGLTVKGSILIEAGASFNTLSQALSVAGNWTNDGTFTQGTGTVTLNGTAAQTIQGASATTFHNLTITNTSAAISATTNFNVDGTGTLTVNAGATLIPDAGVVINNGGANGTITGSGTIKVSRTAATADYKNQYKLTTNTLSSMTVDYSGAGAQTVNSTVGNYGALKTSTSGTKTLEGAVTVNGGVTIGSSTTLDASASNFGMTVGGDWTNNGGTFTPRAGTVTFNSTAAAQAINGTAATQTFNNVTVNKSGQTLSVAGSTTTLTLNGGLTITAGTLSAGTATTINIAADWSNSGTYTSGSSNVVFNGSSAQTIGGSQVTSFNGLKVGNSAGVTLVVNATVTGVLDLASGDITTGSNTLTQTGTSASNGDVVGNTKRSDLNSGTTKPFGNQYVQITRTAGTVVSINVNLVKGSLNNDFTNSVKRLYTITLTTAAGFTANLQLHYLDSELNGNTENNSLQLWRKDGSTWNIQGADASGGHDFTNNWVKLTGVTQFSPWTIAGPVTVTDVSMVSMKATRYDDRVLLEWQTGYEVNNVGFNIYREKGGNLSRITPEPVAGSALIAGPAIELRAGFAYAWWDGDAGDDDASVRYWLEDLDMSGRTTSHGPFGIDRPSPDDHSPAPVTAKASLLSAFGHDASAHGSTVPVEHSAKVAKPTPAKLELQGNVASQTAVKLSIQREGWYRLEQPELVAAGLPASLDPQKLQLFVDGVQVPMTVTGEKDGKFDPTDAVEFYGVGINSAFTVNHVYWLSPGAEFGLRIQHAEGKSGSPAPGTFSYTVERRDKLIYVPAVKNNGGEKFFGPLIFDAQPTDQSLVLQHVAPSGAEAVLEVSLQGFTQTPHSVRVMFNGSELGVIKFGGLDKGTAKYSISQSALREGSNQVQLIGPPGFTDISLAEYVRLTYSHTNAADANALRFPATGAQQVTLTGFTSSSVRVIDVTNATLVQEIDGVVATKADDGGFVVAFNVPGAGSKTLLAFAADQQKKPASMTANQPSTWRTSQAADYVAVTRGKDMADSLQPLVAQRKSQGLSMTIVDIEDIYDEFSFGNKSPQALKDFFTYAKTNWVKAPRFALLAGDATFDPKNYMRVGDFDLVPTRLVETAFNETATDDWFVDLNGDGVPDIAIGRLPVRTAQEMAALVAKIIGYDQSAATNKVLLVADQNEGFDFESADSQLQAILPGSLSLKDIRRGQIGDSAARTQLLDAINQGQKLVNFYGHGSTRLWTSAPLLATTDAASFGNRDRLALFDSMTCLNGFFHDPSIESLGEALLKASGGAIAVWASSGMTDPGAQVQMNQEAIRLLFSDTRLTIGEVTARAKAAAANQDVRRTWILLGDPATRLK